MTDTPKVDTSEIEAVKVQLHLMARQSEDYIRRPAERAVGLVEAMQAQRQAWEAERAEWAKLVRAQVINHGKVVPGWFDDARALLARYDGTDDDDVMGQRRGDGTWKRPNDTEKAEQ